MNQETQVRAASQRQTILEMLRENGSRGVTNTVLTGIALKYGSRLHELYKQGYVIDRVDEGGGKVKYILVSEPEEILSEQPKALDILVEEVNKESVVSAARLKELLEQNGFLVRRKPNSYKQIV